MNADGVLWRYHHSTKIHSLRAIVECVVLLVAGGALLYLVTSAFWCEDLPKNVVVEKGALLRELMCSDLQKTCYEIVDTPSLRKLHVRGFNVSETAIKLVDGEVNVKVFPGGYTGLLLAAPLLMGTLSSIEDPNVSILNIGLGGGEIHAYVANLPLSRRPSILSIELDSLMVKIARRWFGVPPNDATSQVIVQDGIEFLKTNKKKFDLIIIDACLSPNLDDEKSAHCPALVFRNPDVIESIKQSLKAEGVLSVNYLESSHSVKTFDEFYTMFIRHFFSHAAFKVGGNTPAFFSNGFTDLRNEQIEMRLQSLKNISDMFSPLIQHRIR